LGAASCSSSPNHKTASSSTTSSTSAPATTTTASTSVSNTSVSSTSTTAASGCAGVTAAAGQGQGAAGTITGTVILSETAGATCPMMGYPAISLYSSSGASIVVTMVDGLSVDLGGAANAPPAPVTLSPSSKLEFSYQFSDVPSGNQTACPSSATARVTPPGSSTATAMFPLMLSPCDNGTIRVSPLYAAA
jgi:hypothetical protein